MRVLNAFEVDHIAGGEVGATKMADNLSYTGSAGPDAAAVAAACSALGDLAATAATLIAGGGCNLVAGAAGAGACGVISGLLGTAVADKVTKSCTSKVTESLGLSVVPGLGALDSILV